MITTPLDVIVRFDLDTNRIIVTDNTNYELSYAGATANVRGTVETIAYGSPAVYLYDNNTTTPDIIPSVDREFSIALPLNSNGNMNGGLWEVKYNVLDISDDTEVDTVLSCDICVDIPKKIQLIQTVDCLTPVFTSQDTTNYTSCGVAPSLIEYNHVVKYCVDGITPYPADITSTTNTITTNNVYTNSQMKTEIEVYLEYTFCEYFIVSKTLRKVANKEVDCPADLCTIFCCLKGLVNLYNKAVTKGNEQKIQTYKDKLVEVGALITILREAQTCGKPNQSGTLVEMIKDLLNCDGDCGCDDGDQVSVLIPLQVALQSIVSSCGNGIDVTATTSGNTTTYEVCLSQTIIDALNSILEYNVVSASSVISVSSNQVGDTVTYSLAIVPANVPTNLVNVVSGNSNLTVSGAIVSGVYTYTVTLPCPPISNIVGDGSIYDLGISSSIVDGCKTVELAQTLYSNDNNDLPDGTLDIVYPNPTSYNGLGYLYGKFKNVFLDNTNYIGVPASGQNTSVITTKIIEGGTFRADTDRISINATLNGVVWSGSLGTQFQITVNGNVIAQNPTIDYNAQAYVLFVEVELIRVGVTQLQAVSKYTYYNTANGTRLYFTETAPFSVANLNTTPIALQVLTTPILNLYYISADLKRS